MIRFFKKIFPRAFAMYKVEEAQTKREGWAQLPVGLVTLYNDAGATHVPAGQTVFPVYYRKNRLRLKWELKGTYYSLTCAEEAIVKHKAEIKPKPSSIHYY